MAPEDEQLGFRGHPRNIQHTTKAARLLNQTETGIARAVSDESEKFLERQYGRLIVVIDLSFTADTYDIGEVLVDTAEREFYADLNRSVNDAFEHTVTQVNQTLADLAAEGQNEWVGKLGAIIAVVQENQLLVTQVGNAVAHLVRGPTITTVTEGLSDGAGRTSKTFLNIAAGKLEVGDKIIFATDGLLQRVRETDLRRYLYLHAPARVIRKLADDLTAKEPPDRLAAVVVELTTIDLISSEPVSDDPDEIILAAPRRHFEALQRFRPVRSDSSVAGLAAKAKKHYDKSLKPAAARAAAQGRHQIASFIAKRRGQAPPPPPPRPAAGTPETPPTAPAAKPAGSEQLSRTATAAGRGVLEALRPVGRRLEPLWRRTGIPQSRFWQHLTPFARRITARLLPRRDGEFSGRRLLYRNLLIVIALVFGLSLFFSLRANAQRQHETEVRDLIKQVQATQAKAEASFIFKDFPGARRQLADAQREADKLRSEKALKPEIRNLQESLRVSYERINNVVAVPDPPVADFSGLKPAEPLTHLGQAGTTLYAIGDGGQLYSVPQGSGETRVASANPGITGKIRSTAVTSGGNLLLLTDKPAVYEHDAKAGNTGEVGVAAGGAWEKGIALDTVQQNVFVLDPDRNQIFRHSRGLADFSRGEPYVNGQVELQNAVDLVTGTQVYALKSDGRVMQFTGGNQQPFNLVAPPAPEDTVSKPNALAVNSTTGLIYLADPGHRRVLEYDAKGEHIRQFRHDRFEQLKDLVIDDKTNTLFILTDNKLYQIGLAT